MQIGSKLIFLLVIEEKSSIIFGEYFAAPERKSRKVNCVTASQASLSSGPLMNSINESSIE